MKDFLQILVLLGLADCGLLGKASLDFKSIGFLRLNFLLDSMTFEFFNSTGGRDFGTLELVLETLDLIEFAFTAAADGFLAVASEDLFAAEMIP